MQTTGKIIKSNHMKQYILGLAVVVALGSCGTKEKVALQNKVDSLSIELTASRQVEKDMNEVGMLIDSIDASRKSLQMKMIEGNTYGDYINRLKEINIYVKETESKLASLEKSSANKSKASASNIKRLKADLEKRTLEITDLQLQIVKLRDENLAAWTKLNQKDSVLSVRDQLIVLNQAQIASLEKQFTDTQLENRTRVSNLYFAQAAALEKAANRTQFAPRKKKETRREALELYKLSLSMGNMDAQARIDELEKKLS
jgi:hypothetical protein